MHNKDTPVHVFHDDEIVTCPKCGARTYIDDFSAIHVNYEEHTCIDLNCMYEFYVEYEHEEDKV